MQAPKADFLRKVDVTELRDDDTPFIQDTWARAYRVSEVDDCLKMRTAAFHGWHRPRRIKILGRPSTLVLVARDTQNPLFIYGYGVFERIDGAFIAHWVYVKSPFKGRGVGSALLAAAMHLIGEGAKTLECTHRTYFVEKAEEMGFTFRELNELYAGEAA